MAALTNEVLTGQLRELHRTVQAMTDRLNDALPRMDQATVNLQVSFKDIDTRPENLPNLLIQADVLGTIPVV